jgi:hypothetical protein
VAACAAARVPRRAGCPSRWVHSAQTMEPETSRVRGLRRPPPAGAAVPAPPAERLGRRPSVRRNRPIPISSSGDVKPWRRYPPMLPNTTLSCPRKAGTHTPRRCRSARCALTARAHQLRSGVMGPGFRRDDRAGITGDDRERIAGTTWRGKERPHTRRLCATAPGRLHAPGCSRESGIDAKLQRSYSPECT